MDDFVGYRALEVADHELSLTFPMAVLYPTSTPGKVEGVGPYQLDVALGAPLKEGAFPQVFISHGTGGSPLAYRTLAHHLARHGFVVGLPEHPFNNRDDNAWAGTVRNLTARPRHLRLAISALSGHSTFAAFLKPDAVALIGHSLGGYTALALAGGVPTSFPGEAPDGQPRPIPVAADSRVKALVLLAPATAWYRADGALRGVGVPILMLTAEKDEHTLPLHAQVVWNGVPDPAQLEHRTVENAGHFSFLSPFPEARNSPAFPPSQDPPGFNRAGFQAELNAEVLAFLARTI